MKNWTVWTWLLVLFSLLFAVLRLTLPTNGLHLQDVFKDLAHVFTGFLMGMATTFQSLSFIKETRLLWLLVGCLLVVEVGAAVFRG